MDADLSPRLRGLTWFWWSAAGYLASQARRRLGLWPIPVKPFLPRAEQESLKALITFLEAVLRRLFWLEAAGLGALPAGTQPGPVAPAGSGTSRTPAQTPTRAAWPPAAPIFRLRECARPAQATPPPRQYRTGPRIRFLDAPHPVDLRDYSAHPADILPCGKLVRRLLAINHALDFPDRYIKKMRQCLGMALPVLRPAMPPVFRSRKLRHLQQESARQLHAATRNFSAPDTS